MDYYSAVNPGNWSVDDWYKYFCGYGFLSFASCSGGSGGTQPIATAAVTGTAGGVCSNVTIQTKGADGIWKATSMADIAAKVKVGDTVRFVVAGNKVFDKARFRVNDGAWVETTSVVPSQDVQRFYLDYVITSAGQHKVEGQVYGI